MQYNSFLFILLFLPIFISSYFFGNFISKKAGRWIIIIFGIMFYLAAGLKSFAVLMISMVVNYILSWVISKSNRNGKLLLSFSLILNTCGLLLFKGGGFLNAEAESANSIFMPLGISFFTFQQIMYVVNVYKKEIVSVDPVDYIAYIMFFPKMIMGPLVEPNNLISQINNPKLKRMKWDNLASGIKVFSFGLFKKMVLADTFRRGVNWGFGSIQDATAADLILTTLFYTFEIYFDFSGYTDMSIGISKMINIDLPINFDSPYKAVSIRDFWKRWHISLTQFFTKYIYYPLGGSKKGKTRTYVNIMIVFLVSGLWHGSNYTFIQWGCIHGIIMVIERVFDKYFIRLSETVRWLYTFGTVNILWVLFRSESVAQWHTILYKIFTFQNTTISDEMIYSFELPETAVIMRLFHLNIINANVRGFSMLLFTTLAFFICVVPENNYKSQSRRNVLNMVLAAVAFAWGLLCLNVESVFVYYNF